MDKSVSNSIVEAFGNMTRQVWSISIDYSISPVAVAVEGDGCLLQDRGGRYTVSWNNCGRWESFLVIDQKEAYLTAMGGQVCPIYSRRIGSIIRLSNVASRLMRPNETFRIDAFVLLQNLSGISFPRNNVFKDIRLLEASTEYRLSSLGIERLRSALEESTTVLSSDEVLDMAIAQWEAQLSSGADIAVLLSGGYDSRLNLAIACHAARRYGNRVYAFHEYKDAHEESIATAVASVAKVPLSIHDRRAFVETNRAVIMDSSFIRFQSGFYRENLIRWHGYLAHIRTKLPGCVIMGMGAEAHKGKYYRQLESISEDGAKIFGINEVVVETIARKLGLNHQDHDSQRLFFDRLAIYASAFREFTMQVDYVHYQTYVSNGYGHRCHDLQQHFAIPFPFLDNAFLAAVFALPAKEKENFAMVTRGIARLHPALGEIPYISANSKALGPKVQRPFSKALSGIRNRFGPIYYDFFPPRRKGRDQLAMIEREALSSIQTHSSLTALLIDQALMGIQDVPFVDLDYLVQACLYFAQLEQDMDVICTTKVVKA